MSLSGPEIRRQKELGNIVITPWDDARLNPNSYNLTLSDRLAVYRYLNDARPLNMLDMKREHALSHFTIPPEGFVLNPGRLYLGVTVEYTETHGFIPHIDGRSSTGRLGLFTHVTAGRGDVGFRGPWTLELTVVQPLRIYPDIPILQIYYDTLEGEAGEPYSGGYGGDHRPQASKLWRELSKTRA